MTILLFILNAEYVWERSVVMRIYCKFKWTSGYPIFLKMQKKKVHGPHRSHEQCRIIHSHNRNHYLHIIFINCVLVAVEAIFNYFHTFYYLRTFKSLLRLRPGSYKTKHIYKSVLHFNLTTLFGGYRYLQAWISFSRGVLISSDNELTIYYQFNIEICSIKKNVDFGMGRMEVHVLKHILFISMLNYRDLAPAFKIF